jgi:outer membrane protein OmpA-like peptidoglycan-associated protein
MAGKQARAIRIATAAAVVVATSSAPAPAADTKLHGSIGPTQALSSPQGHEFGMGASGDVTLEFELSRRFSVEGSLGAGLLTPGEAPRDPRFAPRDTGTFAYLTVGPRIYAYRPSDNRGGFWVDGGAGALITGPRLRPTVLTRLGYSVATKGRLGVGPFAGYLHVFQPEDALRPEDGNFGVVGVEFTLGEAPRPAPAKPRRDRDGDTVFDDEDACPDVPGIRSSNPKLNGCPAPKDRDKDGVFDSEDACPDVPGIRTSDPKTNGCPRPDRDGDGVYDDEDACPDKVGIRTSDPKTNGCPRVDRDNDTVFDDEDACPDVPGVRTNEPQSNGCPPPDEHVRLEGDRILLDEVILFDIDSPRVRRVSWDIVRKVAQFINANPDVLEVSIEGHADATGTPEHNLYLSKERAESVRRLLVQYGVADDRVKAAAYGKDRLKVATSGAEQKNRRVEFFVTKTRPAEKRPLPQGGAQ